ncbi:fimbrial protein [Lelliottia wanjuensis]|uniref:fimbrial protein n=1 Tax=Lelliottia wanjuensis TaxID=3050585 RepID=UPI002551B57D|nr:hypothetical protein [Lelliottia sp. V86_10]MDK9584419.1 hypothetical protein [Lelliottia sp. V86_10]
MKRTALICLLSLITLSLRAQDQEQERGDVGALFVHGLLQEMSCQIEMTSPWQAVTLRQGRTPMLIMLTDCPEPPLTVFEAEIAPYFRGQVNPVYTASLVGSMNEIGLRLLDNEGREIPILNGKADVPLYAGQNRIRYTIDATSGLAPDKTVHVLMTLALDYR